MFQSTALGVWFLCSATSLYWVGMFTATHLPHARMPLIPLSDKTLHFLAFTGLALLVGSLFVLRKKSRPATAFLICLAYAAFDEWTQLPVGRTPDVLDWLADAAGIAVGLTACVAMRRLFFGAHKSPERC